MHLNASPACCCLFTTLHTLYRNCDWFYCVFHLFDTQAGNDRCLAILYSFQQIQQVGWQVRFCYTSCSKQITPNNFFFYFSSLSWGVPLQLSPHPCLAPDWVHLQYFDLALWLTGKVRTWHWRKPLYPHTTKLLGYVGSTPSVCPSVRPSRIPCPLCSAYSSVGIHFIFIHLIKQLQKVCRV